MKSPLPLAALALLFLVVPSLRADTVMLGAAKDNTIYSEFPLRSNGIGQHMFAGINANGNERRALMAFDLSSIAAGSTINSVTLTLQSNIPATGETFGAFTVGLHRLEKDWGEEASNAALINAQEGLGGNAMIGDATWTLNFADGPGTFPWDTPGGDFAATPSATQTVDMNGSYNWSGAGLVSDLQAWLDGSTPNFGWLINGDIDPLGNPTLKRFATRQNNNVAHRPLLTVEFTPGVVPEPSRAILLFTAAFAIALRRRRS